MLDMGGYGSGARWYLDIAVEHNDLALAEWCLTHGANPERGAGTATPQPASTRSTTRPCFAATSSWRSCSSATAPSDRRWRSIRCRRSSPRACGRTRPAIREEIARHPEFLRAAEPLFAAAKYNRRDAAELLLDLGTSPDVESREGERALHIAAYDDSVDVAELLIARGAEVDPIGRNYDNTPLGGAMHCQSRRMIELLGRVSRSAWEVGYAGNVDRLRELLAEKPERARATGDGETLLMWLPPGDESTAHGGRAAAAGSRRRSHRARSAGHDGRGSGGTERDVQGRGAAEATGIDGLRLC